jgi:hypothetical protein
MKTKSKLLFRPENHSYTQATPDPMLTPLTDANPSINYVMHYESDKTLVNT